MFAEEFVIPAKSDKRHKIKEGQFFIASLLDTSGSKVNNQIKGNTQLKIKFLKLLTTIYLSGHDWFNTTNTVLTFLDKTLTAKH